MAIFRILFILFGISYSLPNVNAFANRNIESRDPNEFPFIVSIGNIDATENDHICGGALISQMHVLTSEHCVLNKRARDLQVTIGNDDLYPGRKYKVLSIMRFDDWTKRHHSAAYPNNDVAILTLEENVIDVVPGLIDNLRPKNAFYGENVETVGWEEDDDNENASRYLQKSILTVLTPNECNKNLYRYTGKRYEINEKYFCTTEASGTLFGKGYEGSPILHNNVIIGVNHGKFRDFTDHKLIDQNLHIGLEYYRRFIHDVLSSD